MEMRCRYSQRNKGPRPTVKDLMPSYTCLIPVAFGLTVSVRNWLTDLSGKNEHHRLVYQQKIICVGAVER